MAKLHLRLFNMFNFINILINFRVGNFICVPLFNACSERPYGCYKHFLFLWRR